MLSRCIHSLAQKTLFRHRAGSFFLLSPPHPQALSSSPTIDSCVWCDLTAHKLSTGWTFDAMCFNGTPCLSSPVIPFIWSSRRPDLTQKITTSTLGKYQNSSDTDLMEIPKYLLFPRASATASRLYIAHHCMDFASLEPGRLIEALAWIERSYFWSTLVFGEVIVSSWAFYHREKDFSVKD